MKISIRESIAQIKTFSKIFVERPRFAMVIAIVLVIAGVVSMFNLPITQYPRITPPEIKVTYNYPGANAREVMNTIATPIEDEINGVDDMIYMNSESADDGSYGLTVSFEVESDRDMDMVKVQNRLALAEPKLPTEAQQLGGRVRAQSSDMLGFIAFRSKTGKINRMQISDYVYNNVQQVLLRIPGVGEATVYGPKLSVRVWMDPDRMAAQKMNSEEVIQAISKQNVQASLGVIGSAPIEKYGAFTFPVLGKGRLMTAEEFGDIIVRRDSEGGMVKLSDVARVEIGEQNYTFDGQLDGKVAVSVGLNQKPGANAIEAMNEVIATMHELEKNFPEDLDWVIPYDATEYVRMCIKEIGETLFITFALVVLVCYLFLQDWKATLVPCLTIPVSLAATFIVMQVLGYSINILSLFGLVLAIGVVVDDCIVVVERVQYLIETRGLNSKEATIQAMSDVTSAVIATTLVLLGIFVPVGFMSGIVGRIYQQFSVTLSAAVCFSTVCALTLAPALCSIFLGSSSPHKHGPLHWFNIGIEKVKGLFVTLAKFIARRLMLSFLLLALTIMLFLDFFFSAKTSFLPDEDQGVVFASMEMPEGSTMSRTRDVALRATEYLKEVFPEVESILSVEGISMTGGRGESQAMLIIELTDWGVRKGYIDAKTGKVINQHAVSGMVPRIQQALAAIPEPSWRVFVPPAIPGLGTNSGVDLRVQSRESNDPELLFAIQNQVLAKLNARQDKVMMAFSGFTSKTPHLRFHMDRTKAEMYHVPVATAYTTLQNYLGSRYVNDVNLGTQVNRVTVRSDWKGRDTPEALGRLYVRSDTGNMVPMDALGTLTRETGPRIMQRFNMFPASNITIMPQTGVATGEVIALAQQILKETLPKGFGYEWGGITFQEQRNAGSALPLFGMAFLFGYLFLVAQYESWTIPLPVMLSIFVAVFGALFGLKFYGILTTGAPYSLSVYAQLGLVLLVGLASKNAILIVEFAKDKRENEGYSIVDAAGIAAGERLRALLMTALTTLLGALPMVIATGAGAASRNAIGVTEFFGMAFSVCFGVMLVPGLYSLFQTWRERVKRSFDYVSTMKFRRKQLKERHEA